MNEIDLSENRVAGGFFLLKESKSVPYEWPRDNGGPYGFVGTYAESGSPLRDTLIAMIRQGKHRVFVASFMIGDEELIAELVSAAQRLKGGVYVITALDERSLNRGLEQYEGQEQEAPELRRKNFERLTTQGIYVRGHEYCHAKFAVIDDTVALVGSANFVRNAFEWTGEAAIVIRQRSQVAQLARLFAELWYEGCTWEVPPGATYVVAKRSPQKPPARPVAPDGHPGEIVWTNGHESTSLLRAIQRTINNATKSLALSTYSLASMTDDPSLLFEPLKRAKDRGVEIRFFIRQRNAWPEQMHELLALDDMGAKVFGDTRNHAKAVVADGREGVVFSANFDAKHGLTTGVEVGVVLPNEEVARQVQHYLDHVIEHADTAFVRAPTLAELDGHLAARWCSRCELPGTITVRATQGDWEELVDATSRGAVLYERKDEVTWLLFAGDKLFELQGSEGGYRLRVNAADIPLNARLEDWLRSSRAPEITARRGFCSSRLAYQPL